MGIDLNEWVIKFNFQVWYIMGRVDEIVFLFKIFYITALTNSAMP